MTSLNIKPKAQDVASTRGSFSVQSCPICNHDKLTYRFKFAENTVWNCQKCEGQFLSPQPSNEVLNALYDADYFLGGNTADAQALRQNMKKETSKLYLLTNQFKNGQTT